MEWWESRRFDPFALALADRHYNRQKPGTPQFVPPGRCLVLLTALHDALWVTSWPAHSQHAWAGAWVNTLFRNEGTALSSGLILQAVAVTRWYWGEVPERGMVTFIDAAKIRSTNPGYCYQKAGFRRVGLTKKAGLVVMQMLPGEMPEAARPEGAEFGIFDKLTRRR